MPRLGPWEIALILLIVLIVFGVGKLPQVGSALGKGLREFNKARSGEDEEKEKSKSAKPEKDKEKKES
ncbi:MAG: twin-arginine translocase TatA/TatE family subunit [Chloroflexota bacterium]